MKKLTFSLFCLVFGFICQIRADEGMWFLPLIEQLNMKNMTEMGLKLSSEEIYNINQSSLKDAVVIFDGGCTGDLISDQGLILTNHHCGFDAIQYHSTVDNDYLETGFWAQSFNEEIPTPDLEITFLIRIEDVTASIDSILSDTLTERERRLTIDNQCTEIENRVPDENKYYSGTVKPFFEGNKYYLFIYEKYNDIRFVGAPPSSIGKFGGDTDNWMWPRHTGDFSLFRIYADSSGNPAAYSPNNIPLRPKHFFSISLKGYQENDFTLILGYPGSTDRYTTSYELKELSEITNPNRIKIRGLRQELLMEDMNKDTKVQIQYASKYSRSSNYWKFSIGQNKGIERLQLLKEKQDFESNFQSWIEKDSIRKVKYGNSLASISEAMSNRRPYTNALQYINEGLRKGCEVLTFAYDLKPYVGTLKTINQHIVVKDEFVNAARLFYKDYNPETDRKVIKAMIKLYSENVPPTFRPSFYQIIKKKYKNNIDKFVDKLFNESVFTDSSRYFKFLNNPENKVLNNDMAFITACSIADKYKELFSMYDYYNDVFYKGRRLYMAGLMEMENDKHLYPDANFTMRLTYGKVKGYYPRDAVKFNYYTTLTGVFEKEDSISSEFIVPEKLTQLYNQKEYGIYAQDSIIRTCFITDNDITGGNSGSAVLNGNGDIIGLAFDGNWEAMSGDIKYEPDIQRCINLDIRYFLFIVDKYAGATRLIDEMKIIQ